MYYMMVSLMNNEVSGKCHIRTIFWHCFQLDCGLQGFYRCISVLFNSFLMKQRLKEIGLYNILGMEKRHIAVMMFFENVFVFITVFVSGMILGMVFSN